VGAATFVSRVLGFARDVVIARFFGAGLDTDAFFVAFKIPNFLRRLFAEGAFNQAFVPVLAEYRTQRNAEDLRGFVNRVCGTLGAVLMLVTVLGILAAPVLIAIFAPGFLREENRYDLAVEMLRITFPYLLFIALTAFAGSILNSYEQFAVPALTPVFLNLSLIGAAIWLAPTMEHPVVALAWGVLVAGIVQLALQLPFLARLALLPRPRIAPRDDGVRKIARLMLPAVFGVSVTQINLLVDTLIASLLTTGSISWLYYSDRLVEFPLGVFGIALATVILPNLSKQHAQSNPHSFSSTLDWGLRWVLLIGTPAALGLVCLAGPMLATLFQYEEFTDHDVVMSARSLQAYSVGLLGFILVKVLAPGFFARQDTKTPVRIGVKAMLANMLLNVLLVFPLAHAGLALATSLSACLNAGLLYHGLRREGVYSPSRGWPRFLLQCVVANSVMVGYLLLVPAPLESWLDWGLVDRVGALMIHLLVAAALYFCVLFAVGIRPRQLARSA
jgi:putative peptidoglycan lipid II flippase